MTNMQLYISIGLPTLLILLGLLLNWSATKDVATWLGVIESDMRQFYRAIGKLEGRMDAVEK
ncbi:MAG TPA: hypothetical protein VFC39_04305 [Acidobacteriaceae bacterium]|jgi:hypothetical protein|nr:hypothetical protein [Acidobacteriaceae bacterium]